MADLPVEACIPAGLHVVAFVGHSGSGKTTLLLKAIPVLRAQGIRVAVVKHSSHRGVQTDIPGSDTRRLWDAGADRVALVTPDRMALTRRLGVEPSLATVLATIALEGDEGLRPAAGRTVVVGDPREPQRDLMVLVEGYKRSRVPKVEVIRAACNPHPIAHLENRIACVTDVPGLDLGCPMFDLNDVDGVVRLLVQRAGGGDGQVA